MKPRSGFFITTFFFALSLFTLPSFAAPALPSGLPDGFTSWGYPLLMTCAVRTQTGGLAEHALELYNKMSNEEFRSVEIHRLNSEAYLAVYFRSSPRLLGSGLDELVYFVRENNRWVKHAFPGGVTADTRAQMFAFAEKGYLKPRGLTNAALKKCIRNGNE